MNLFDASNQWATRPDDERFSSLAEMHAATRAWHESAAEARLPWNRVQVTPADDGSQLMVGGDKAKAALTHYAFGQVAQRIGAPADYLRSLPMNLVADAVTHGLRNKADATDASLLLHRNGHLIARCITSTRYERIWNHEVCERLTDLPPTWRVPPARPCRSDQAGARPATEADVLADSDFGLSINVGDMIAPAGLYASDRDMFAFMVNEAAIIEHNGERLARGFYISNSEVGDSALKLTTFLYRHVCGNHIVWGAENVREIRVIHMGHNARRWRVDARQLSEYVTADTANDCKRIEAAKSLVFGGTKDEVLDRLFGFKDVGLSRKTLELAYTTAEQNPDSGNPRSAWGMVNGLTRYSQTRRHQSERATIDRAAGRILARVEL